MDRRVLNFVHRARCNPQAPPSTSLVDHNIDRQWRKFLSPEFRAKFQRGVSELPTIPARRASTISNCSYFSNDVYHTHTHTHTHTRLTALFPGLPGSAGTRKVKPIWILLKQETESGSGISWAICKCAPRSRQITTPATHHSVFYRPDALPAAQPTASKQRCLLPVH